MAKKESKSKNQKLEEKLVLKKENAWLKYTTAEKNNVFKFSEDYKKFLDESKTERLAVKSIVQTLNKSGFKNIKDIKKAKSGDKIYKVIKEKSVVACIVGKDMTAFNILGSHIDSPRLDLKPNPLYEDSEFAMLKTHYYGGIKKYQWVNTPLMIAGVVFTKDGKQVDISIGDKEDDPKFIIPDLLPHLAKDQMQKEAQKIIEGEGLNLFIGSIPINDDDIKEKVKFSILKYLNDTYGLIEEDFGYAELEVIPSNKSSDIGFDRGLIAAYGQDDKVCAYLSLKALTEIKAPKTSAMSIFFDKEEIGSTGNTGAVSLIMPDFIEDYKKLTGVKDLTHDIFSRSMAISADVSAGFDPNYKDVHEPKNAAYINKGVVVEKYTGSGGKYSASDANAEFLAYLRPILDKNKISYQFAELGKIDLGGGGTIALYLAKYGLDIIDAGPGILGMHSPYEVLSKADIYECYKFYKAFYEN